MIKLNTNTGLINALVLMNVLIINNCLGSGNTLRFASPTRLQGLASCIAQSVKLNNCSHRMPLSKICTPLLQSRAAFLAFLPTKTKIFEHFFYSFCPSRNTPNCSRAQRKLCSMTENSKTRQLFTAGEQMRDLLINKLLEV